MVNKASCLRCPKSECEVKGRRPLDGRNTKVRTSGTTEKPKKPAWCAASDTPHSLIYIGVYASRPKIRLPYFYCSMSLTYREVLYEYWKGGLSIGKGKVSVSNTS